MKKTSSLKYIVMGCALVCLLLGVTVIFGWMVESDRLIQVFPFFAPMQFNTALGFCLFGSSTILVLREKYFIGSIASLLGGLLGLLTLIQYLLGINLGIDEFFMEAYITVKTSNPGRMAPNTALCFFLSGVASQLIARGVKFVRVAGVISTLIFTLGVVAFEGYLVDIEVTYGWANFTRMAVHTASGFMILGLSLTVLSWVKERKYRLTNNEEARPWFIGYAFSILFALFVIDIGLPLGVAAGTLYIPLVLFGWYVSDIKAILVLGIAATLFTWMGFIFSPSGAGLAVVIANRCISVLAIWITTYQLYQNKRKKVALAKSEELLQAEEQFKNVVEFAPNSIVLVDKAGVISMVNRKTETLFGYSREELIGSKQDILIPRVSGDNSPDEFFGSTAAGRMLGKDFMARRKNGTEIQVEINLNHMVVDDREMALATIIDVTERKEQVSTIKKQMAELTLKNRELEQLAYIASHDLQEPLRTVSNYLQVIEEDFEEELSAEVVKYFDSIKNAIGRMGKLVRALLDFSRLGKGRKLEKTDCKSLVATVMADLDNLISETKTSIKVKKLPSLLTYKTEFRQLFQNLISNAIKFRKSNESSQIEVQCEETSDHWKFSVRDNGIGIEEMNFERIFHIFQRLHQNGKFEGNGIGLANCKKIAQLHGGDIWVESELDKGSTFYFTVANLNTS